MPVLIEVRGCRTRCLLAARPFKSSHLLAAVPASRAEGKPRRQTRRGGRRKLESDPVAGRCSRSEGVWELREGRTPNARAPLLSLLGRQRIPREAEKVTRQGRLRHGT
eukprot:767894-Hanusia_phi.AAC.1